MAEVKHIRTLRSKKLHPEHVKLINDAIRKNARGKEKDLHITYRKENGEVSERKVRPLAVKGKSLFVAHCHKRNAIRSFKVERISMIKSAFWEGFEKRSYDYKQEAKDLQERFSKRSKSTPIDMKKSLLWGSGLGSLGGGLIGALKGGHGSKQRLIGAGLGGLLGASLGGLTGAIASISSVLGIEEAKRIMSMPQKDRDVYLRSLARKNEISEQQYRDWSRDLRQEYHD